MSNEDAYRTALVRIAQIEHEASSKVGDMAYTPATSGDYLRMVQIANAALDQIGDVILDTDESLYDETPAS